jgi:hypothetical protein
MSESLPSPMTTSDSPYCFQVQAAVPSLADGQSLYHLSLLLFEASVATLVSASFLTTTLDALIYSPNDISANLGITFIAAISITALTIGICCSIQNNLVCLYFWRALYHAPFLTVAYSGFKLSGPSSEGKYIFILHQQRT